MHMTLRKVHDGGPKRFEPSKKKACFHVEFCSLARLKVGNGEV